MAATADPIQLEQLPPNPALPMAAQFSDDPAGWVSHARRIASEAQVVQPRVVFIGDSITQAWCIDGLHEWDERFAHLPAANLGIGGDRTYNVLWRIRDGAFDGITPELVVLLIGVNNLWTEVDHWGPERVSEGIAAVVSEIRAACPATRILALGILPTQAHPEHPLRDMVRAVNAHSSSTLLTGDGSVHFVDIGEAFVEPDGTISADIMPDGCHLSPQGYKIFAYAIAPLIYRMLTSDARNTN